MLLTRRQFFKTAAVASTALVVMSSPVAALAECPRQIAFRMKDHLVQDWNAFGKTTQWFNDVDAFYEHLYYNITGPQKTFDEIVDEISVVLKGVTRDGTKIDMDIMNCTEHAFAVCLLRDCLKYDKMPMVQARTWKKFAGKYTSYVMYRVPV